MKIPGVALAMFTIAALFTPALGACQAASRPAENTPATPASVKGVLAARRFTLQTPYTNTWSKERGQISTGTLVVLEVDPAYVVPRNSPEPVLYAGDVAVQRLNQGNVSGRVVAIVPGTIDLASAPIWFGTPGLPERVTPALVREERTRAENAGVRALPFNGRAVERTAVNTKDLATLLRTVAAELVYEFSPQEKTLADYWRLPEATAPPNKRSN